MAQLAGSELSIYGRCWGLLMTTAKDDVADERGQGCD